MRSDARGDAVEALGIDGSISRIAAGAELPVSAISGRMTFEGIFDQPVSGALNLKLMHQR